VGGVLLAGVLVGFLAETRAILVVGLPLPIGGLFAAFGLGVTITLVGAALPAWRAARTSPLDAARPGQRGERGLADRLRPIVLVELAIVLAAIGLLVVVRPEAPLVPVLASLALLIGGALAATYLLEPLGSLVGRPFEWFFGAQGLLGRVNLSRDRVRTGLTVGTMMIALAAVVALGTVAESVRAGVADRVGSILPGGHAIRASLPLEVEAYRGTFEATTGVDIVSPVPELPIVRSTPDGPEEAALAGIEPNLFADTGSLDIVGATRADAFEALRDGGAVLVPQSLAERAGIEVGDRIGLATPGGEATELAVAGLVEHSFPGRSPDGALLVSSADARDLFGATSASLWILVPQPEVPDSAFSAAVRETASQLAARPVDADDLAGDDGRTLERLAGLFDAMALVAVVIGALGIVNTLGVGVGERVREIAILRSNGMTVGQVEAMVVTEAAIMGAVAGLLAAVVGILVAVALISGGAAAGVADAVRLPWPLLIAVLLAGTGVAALAGIYPARVAASLPIVRHLTGFE
jgi:putative ABC transport system permease protein